MNEYEKTMQQYQMRVLGDNLELELIKQTKSQQRLQYDEKVAIQRAQVDRDLQVIKGEGQKAVSEINEKTIAEQKRIAADSEWRAAGIRAQT